MTNSRLDCPVLARQGRLQVLLVDDEIDQLLPLADVLQQGGLAPTIATSDDEVLFEVEVSQPDVVVVDAEMADRGLFSQLRALIPTLPVVLMSSAPRHDTLWGAMLATVGVAHIEKPVDARKLLALLADSSRFPRDSAQSLVTRTRVSRRRGPMVRDVGERITVGTSLARAHFARVG